MAISRYDIALGRNGAVPDDHVPARPSSVHIEITRKQRLFLQARSRGRVYLGGIGSGKSRIICYWAILQALQGKRGALVSFSYRNILDVLVHTMHESMEVFGLEPLQDYTFAKGDMCFYVRGVQILLRSADDPNRLRGLNLNWFALDEAREFPDNTVFNVLLGRLRDGEDACWAVSSTTKGRNWFWDIIHQAELDSAFTSGYAANRQLSVIIQSSRENTFLPRAYLEELEARYSTQIARQELEGGIVDFSAGIFREGWFNDRDLPYKPTIGIRGWDVAASVSTSSDYSVGALVAKHKDGHYNVVDVIRHKSLYPKDLIVETALRDGPGVTIVVETVGMQKTIYSDLLREPRLAGYKIKAYKTTKSIGDKLTRALPLASRLEQGVLKICNGTWNTPFIEEFTGFDGTGASHDDQVDAVSIAWSSINQTPVFRVPTQEQYKCSDDIKKDFQKIASIELSGYTAIVLRAVWHPHLEILQVSDQQSHDTIEGLAACIKPCLKRVGCETLDNTEYKTINGALVKAGVSVSTGPLDVPGAIYWLNRMIDQGKVYIPQSVKVYSELIAAEPDMDMAPELLCLLRIAAEVRSWVKPKEKVWAPFEKARAKFKSETKIKEESDNKPKEWVN